MTWFPVLWLTTPILLGVGYALLRSGGPLRPDRSAPTGPDPFDALQVQTRLTIVAEQLRLLEDDQHSWARAERLLAGQLAYDALLAEACRLADVPVHPHPRGDPWERLREEVELTARGWTW